MIEWWGWLLIWSGLVLALLVMLGLFAWWLFRKSLVLLDDLAELADTTAALEGEDAELVRPRLAVLTPAADIRAREEARQFHRRERRRRRVEARLARARRIIRVDATQVEWPAEWYHSARSRRQRLSWKHPLKDSEGS